MKYSKSFRNSFLMMLIAILFLIDPMCAFVDILPDVIGYALLFFALFKLSDLYEGFADCRKKFQFLFSLGIVQLLAELLVQLYMRAHVAQMNRYELPVTILLCSFLVMLLKLCWFIPALRMLFDEMERLSHFAKVGLDPSGESKNLLLNGQALPQTAVPKKEGRIKRICTVCIAISAILAVIPELTVLTSFEAVAEDPLLEFEWYQISQQGIQSENNWFDWFPYVGGFRTLAVFFSLISGIVAILSCARYFIPFMKDQALLNMLATRYENEFLTQNELLTVRKLRTSFGLIFLGTLFTLCLRVGHYPIFPSFGFAIFVSIAIFLLQRLKNRPKETALSGLPLFFISTVGFVLNVRYLKEHLPKDSLYQTKAYYQFLYVRGMGVLEAFGILILSVALYVTLKHVIYDHVWVEYPNDPLLSERATARAHTGLLKKLRWTFGGLLACAVVNAAQAWLEVSVPWGWLPACCVSVAAMVAMYSFMQALYEQICSSYRSNGVNKYRS